MEKELNRFEKLYQLALLSRNKHAKRVPKKLVLRLFKDFYNSKIIQIENKFLINSFLPPFPSQAFDRYIVSFLNNKNSILTAHISVTNRCNYNCKFCSNKYKEGKEMSLEDVKKVIRLVQDRGVPIISFTGGEPLLRKDILDIVRDVGSKSVSYIFSSGYSLDEKKAKELKEAGLFGIAISLDSHKSEVNDSLRGYNGAFEIAINAIRNSKKAGLYTVVQTIVTKESADDVFKFLNFVREIGADEVRILELLPCGKIIGRKDNLLDEKEREKLKAIHILANKRKDLPKVSSYSYIESEKFCNCAAGYTMLYIDSGGEVCPCDMVPLSFGNLLKEDFEAIWKKMRKVFFRPNKKCFLLEYSDKILEKFNGKFPLSYEDSIEICKNYCPETSADYFTMLENNKNNNKLYKIQRYS